MSPAPPASSAARSSRSHRWQLRNLCASDHSAHPRLPAQRCCAHAPARETVVRLQAQLALRARHRNREVAHEQLRPLRYGVQSLRRRQSTLHEKHAHTTDATQPALAHPEVQARAAFPGRVKVVEARHVREARWVQCTHVSCHTRAAAPQPCAPWLMREACRYTPVPRTRRESSSSAAAAMMQNPLAASFASSAAASATVTSHSRRRPVATNAARSTGCTAAASRASKESALTGADTSCVKAAKCAWRAAASQRSSRQRERVRCRTAACGEATAAALRLYSCSRKRARCCACLCAGCRQPSVGLPAAAVRRSITSASSGDCARAQRPAQTSGACAPPAAAAAPAHANEQKLRSSQRSALAPRTRVVASAAAPARAAALAGQRRGVCVACACAAGLNSCAAAPRVAPGARTCGKRAQALRAGAGGEARLHEKQQRVLGQHRLSCTYVARRHQAAPAARQLHLVDGPHCARRFL
jgi:hypothetical protein